MFKTVAAFANGYGGNMMFGVEKDEATVCGLDGIDPLRERDRLAQLVRAIVTPAMDLACTWRRFRRASRPRAKTMAPAGAPGHRRWSRQR